MSGSNGGSEKCYPSRGRSAFSCHRSPRRIFLDTFKTNPSGHHMVSRTTATFLMCSVTRHVHVVPAAKKAISPASKRSSLPLASIMKASPKRKLTVSSRLRCHRLIELPSTRNLLPLTWADRCPLRNKFGRKGIPVWCIYGQSQARRSKFRQSNNQNAVRGGSADLEAGYLPSSSVPYSSNDRAKTSELGDLIATVLGIAPCEASLGG